MKHLYNFNFSFFDADFFIVIKYIQFKMQTIETVQVPDFTGSLPPDWHCIEPLTGTSSNSTGDNVITIDSSLVNIYSSLGENAKLHLDLVKRTDAATPTTTYSYEIKGKITLNTSAIHFEAPVLSQLYQVLEYAVGTTTTASPAPKCVEFYAYITHSTGKFRNLSNNIILKFKLFGSEATPPVYNNFNISLMNLGQRCELPMSTPPYVKETSTSCCDSA